MCPDGSLCINDLVNYLGYDFATTSYSVNGLAVLPGILDVVELVDLYTAKHGPPSYVYLVGASEGGLITTLAVEQYPDVFDGGLATCGPIGDFVGQVNYFGDFRVVLDYYFPDLMPGDPTNIPPELIEGWDSYYADEVYPELADPANRNELEQVVRVTDIAYDPGDLRASLETSVADVLWYNVFATNDGNEVLYGQPFDNMDRIYTGSYDDEALNAGIERFSADQAAIDEIEANYQTTGVLAAPLVTMHTILDQQVPYWHEELYLQKTMASGAWPDLHVSYPPAMTYGHCAFAVADVLDAFNLLVAMVKGQGMDLDSAEVLLSALDPEARRVKLHTIPSPRSP
jgi:pimeloyl-ACP methyl ester carboxylesterase